MPEVKDQRVQVFLGFDTAGRPLYGQSSPADQGTVSPKYTNSQNPQLCDETSAEASEEQA
jgi:hypothetical protein